MRDNSNRYFYLMALLMGSFIGVLAIIALVFFILKLCAVTLFHIPGSGYVFEVFITIVPYLIIFTAYYIVHREIVAAKSSASAAAARVILTVGSLICVAGMIFTLMLFFKVRAEWLLTYEDYSRYTFAGHFILVLITAGVLATGDEKQKSWLERS